MCKLLVLDGHPQKLVECKNKCYDGSPYDVIVAGATLWVVALAIASLGLYLIS